jgi:hypothetical protein
MQMNDNQSILKRAETLSGVRLLALTLLALSVFGVAGALILRHVQQNLASPEQIEDIRYISHAVWFACLLTVVVINSRIRRNPQLKNLIHDEREKALRLRSFAAGFWVFMVAVVCAILAAVFIDIDLKSTLLLILCLGGTTPAFAQAIQARQS